MENKMLSLLMKFATARIDIKNYGVAQNDLVIIKNSDISADIKYPSWFKDDDGRGMTIHSTIGELSLELKCINSGNLKIRLRGIDCRDKGNERFPVFIDFTDFEINNEKIISQNILTNHDNPYVYTKKVDDSEIIKIFIKWLPFNNLSVYDDPLAKVKKRLTSLESQIKTIPMLSTTPFGKSALNGKIIYRNWRVNSFPRNTLMDDVNGFCENLWFTKYLKHKFPDVDFKINFFGPFGKHDNLKLNMDGKKVFYSGEDLNFRFLEMKNEFGRYALDYVDFSMGFDFVDNPKYMRFPNWIRYQFSPYVTDEEIEKIIDYWNASRKNKTENVVNVSSHDSWNTRTLIANDISEFVDITYGGKWRNNSNELFKLYNNDKKALLRKFKFDLCAENLSDDAYVTEKIFDSIICDCIPLYIGGGNYLEPEVLNHNAILRWYNDEGSDNSDTIELFKNLLFDEKTYQEFKDQDKLLESSKKYVINIFSELEKHFERIIYG